MRNNALGLMSGTSSDGLTICLMDVPNKKIIHFKNYSYPIKLQKEILNAKNLNLEQLSLLNFKLGRIYLSYTKKFLKYFKINKKNIAVIGSHGQTLYHNAKKHCTLQIGEATFLSKSLKIPVVCNFRAGDIALGGSGAPLVPALEEYMLATKRPVLLLNIGGISNVSYVLKNRTIGADIGPGNVLSDYAIQILTKGKKSFDIFGKLASKYKPDIKRAKEIVKYFTVKKNISLDRDIFCKPFFDKYFKTISSKDISTLNYLTALIIANNLKKFVPKKPMAKILFISGGGLYNKTLLNNLKALLPHLEIAPFTQIPPMAKEAAIFAYLAWETINKRPSGCPRSTGALQKTILGSIILP